MHDTETNDGPARPERIAIVGAGLMGHGIAQVFAAAGHDVRVHDVDVNALATLRDRVARNLADLGLDTQAARRVHGCAELGDAVRDADVVFEAGPENLDWKRSLFVRLEALVRAETLLASNTSVIPITRIMCEVERGQRAMGTHWWNPPYLVPLVEVIRTPRTDPDAARRMSALLAGVGKTPAIVDKDVAGFIGNRLQHALWREAIALVADGVCDAETIDTVVKASFGRRLAVLGPLENADLVGTDLTLAIHETVLPEIDATRGASPYLKELVRRGHLGMKSGEGFRHWTPERQAELRARVLAHLKSMNAAEGR